MVANFRPQYSLYKRQLKEGLVYYVRFLKPDGSYSSGKKTGQKNKRAAIAWVEENLNTELLNTTPTFGQFSQGFYDKGGKYEQSRILFSRRKPSEKHQNANAYRLEKYLLPVFKDVPLDKIKTSTITKLQIDLSASLAPQTVLHVVNALSIILKYAAETDVISNIPIIKKISLKQQQRDCLTVEEARTVLNAEWPDIRHRLINVLAATTGMRNGELLGLKWEAVKNDYIEIYATWSDYEKRCRGTFQSPATKAGKIRYAPLSDDASRLLNVWRMLSPFNRQDDFVFSSAAKRPLAPTWVLKILKRQITNCGIDTTGRKIDFHSWRHFYNSMLINARIPLLKVRSIVGHADDKMSETYFHANDCADVKLVVENSLKLT